VSDAEFDAIFSRVKARGIPYGSGGGARNTSLVHLTKTLAVQLGRFGITVNCIHPGTTRPERRLLAARATELGIAPDSPRGNAMCRMVDATEIAPTSPRSSRRRRRGR
jgi:NAD(P)-dependent dehydrogenase (short-subunit alcohol dehydrogenase family)